MKIKLCWLVVASVAICLGLAERAEAYCYGSLDAQWNGVSPGQGVTVNAYPGTIESPGLLRSLATTGGVYNFIKKGGDEEVTGLAYDESFWTHCIDISEYVGGLEQWWVTDVDDAPDPNTYLGSVNISDAKEDLLRKLFFLYPGNLAAQSQTAAARQIAVWEIVFEHWKGLNALDATSSFWVTGNALAGGEANTMLNAVASYSWQYLDPMPILYAFVDRDTSDQDQLWLLDGGTETYIPEPVTVLGMFLGLGSVGAYIRRRRMM